MKLFSLISLFFPPSKLKNKILNLFPNKMIASSAYIGFSYINVNHFIVEDNVRVKHLIRMNGVDYIHLQEGSYIGNHNTFYCDAMFGDRGRFILGRTSELVRQNSVDLTSNITIGDNVVIGGFGTQLWTHGFDVQRNRIQGEIVIGDNVYIGSSSIFNLGVSVCSNVSIGSSSVVSKSITESGLYAGTPAVKKHSNYVVKESDSIVRLFERDGSQFFEKKL